MARAADALDGAMDLITSRLSSLCTGAYSVIFGNGALVDPPPFYQSGHEVAGGAQPAGIPCQQRHSVAALVADTDIGHPLAQPTT
jgi:hypothetical protein